MKAATAVLAAGESMVLEKPDDFGSLMAAEQTRIYLLCLKMLRNSDDADSATQDVFVEASRALERSDDRAIKDPAKWLTRVALNFCCDRLRSKRWMFWQRRISGEDHDAVLRFTPAAGLSPEDALIAREVTRRIGSSLHKLSARQRLIFLLRFDEDCTLAEIADLLDLDLGTVKAHMARALKKLREELRGLYVR